MENQSIIVRVATETDKHFAEMIAQEMEESAKARGTGIAKRSPDYIRQKIDEGKAVIALTRDRVWAGFCYIEAWEHEKYVANSGLIVSPPFRKTGIATEIKKRIFTLSREKYPQAKIFGLTTGLAVMKINSDLGYEPVTYSELTNDEEFWKGCRSCVNFEILMSKGRKNCLCTAMLFDPDTAKKTVAETPASTSTMQTDSVLRKIQFLKFINNPKLFDRWMRLKQFILFKAFRKKGTEDLAGGKKNLFGILFW